MMMCESDEQTLQRDSDRNRLARRPTAPKPLSGRVVYGGGASRTTPKSGTDVRPQPRPGIDGNFLAVRRERFHVDARTDTLSEALPAARSRPEPGISEVLFPW